MPGWTDTIKRGFYHFIRGKFYGFKYIKEYIIKDYKKQENRIKESDSFETQYFQEKGAKGAELPDQRDYNLGVTCPLHFAYNQ